MRLTYPLALGSWFDDLAVPSDDIGPLTSTVSLEVTSASGRYRVALDDDVQGDDLELGDALALTWERLSFQLIDTHTDALVLHAAALRWGTGLIILPGESGAGKTRLSLWLRSRGFDLGTDEVVALTTPRDSSADTGVLAAALGRPIILKEPDHSQTLLRADEADPERQIQSASGLFVKLGGKIWSEGAFDRVFIVFPKFVAGVPFTATALTSAQASMRLMGASINVRNLPRGGVPNVSLIGRTASAISLTYGDTAQLEAAFDVLVRQVLASAPPLQDLEILCEAFSAKAARSASISSSTPPPMTRSVLAPTPMRFPRRLTVGMATYDDYDGVYFTVQALRLFHPELEGALEFVVVDNNPGGPCSEALADLAKSIDGYRYVPRGGWSGTAVRNAVFEEASSDYVLCVDAHVLIAPGAVAKLIAYLDADPENRDLLQGPLLYDDLKEISTHFDPQWRGGMYGTWGCDPRGLNVQAPPFAIPMQGCGLFACRKLAWPTFNASFRGFGGEEGYIHEKIRQNGGRTLCLPFLRWVHRFGRPLGAPYVNRWEDRIRNYVIGWTELGLSTAAMEAHFGELLGSETASRILSTIVNETNASVL